MKDFSTHFLLFAILFAAQAKSAEPKPAANELPQTHPVVLPKAEYFDLQSKSGRAYRIFVAGPTERVPETGSPVIYLSDGNQNFPLLLAAARKQVRDTTSCVVVGIGYPTDDPQEIRQFRAFDLMPPAAPGLTKSSSKRFADLKTGGNAQFADFIETELKPIIERKFQIDRDRQTLFGHSFGGHFVLHVLFTRPEMFQTYVATSPSIWFDNGAVLKEEQAFLERFRGKALNARLLLMVGDSEQPPGSDKSHPAPSGEQPRPVGDEINEMSERLSAARLEGFVVQSRVFEDEGHGSVMLPAAGRGVRFALGDRPLTTP